ncbi:hypothetical protein [Flavobacterium hercynium]|uniref:Lipoprotein n=1 Tax=Flavobacterium hercynium TaxID=387094 RepID=A0A226GQ11_9FLAO|nr:hypothetical protein [Flavobacterium hercynium]OXA84047.1 hypothetical protein B0A66_21400 [Flavobacterium hercynium]SMP37089.1 hypothetical protein SAMN06265346_12641 [Flavobacterium hercynium]
MTKKAALLFLIFITFSCKKGDNLDTQKTVDKENSSLKETDSLENTKNNTSCSQLAARLVESSNIRVPYKGQLIVQIEENDGIKMKFRLFPKIDKLGKTVGRVIFDAKNKSLFDITKGIENPVKLTFDNKLWNQVIECAFHNDKSYYIEESDVQVKEEDCITTNHDMETIEKCMFKNTNLKSIYDELISGDDESDFKYLSKVLPVTNETVSVNQNGIMDIDYKIFNLKKVEITMNYAGGVTTVLLEEIKNTVKRTITYSAD